MSVSAIFGPLVATYVFAWFTRPDAAVLVPGAAFVTGAVLMFVALIFAVLGLRAAPVASAVEPAVT